MALISCPECKREVSDRAALCVHCGYPLTQVTEALVHGHEPGTRILTAAKAKMSALLVGVWAAAKAKKSALLVVVWAVAFVVVVAFDLKSVPRGDAGTGTNSTPGVQAANRTNVPVCSTMEETRTDTMLGGSSDDFARYNAETFAQQGWEVVTEEQAWIDPGIGARIYHLRRKVCR